MPVLGHALRNVPVRHVLEHVPKHVPDRHVLDRHMPEHVLPRHVLGHVVVQFFLSDTIFFARIFLMLKLFSFRTACAIW